MWLIALVAGTFFCNMGIETGSGDMILFSLFLLIPGIWGLAGCFIEIGGYVMEIIETKRQNTTSIKVEYTITGEQYDRLVRLAGLWQAKTGRIITPEEMLEMIVTNGCAYDLKNRMDFWERELA